MNCILYYIHIWSCSWDDGVEAVCTGLIYEAVVGILRLMTESSNVSSEITSLLVHFCI